MYSEHVSNETFTAREQTYAVNADALKADHYETG